MSRRLAGQLTRYLAASVLSAATTLGLPILLAEGAGLDPRPAVGIALVVAFILNFALIRRFVFGRRGGGAGGDLLRFGLTSLAFRGAEYLGFLLLLDRAGLPYAAALGLVLIVSFCAKFIVQKRFVFRTRGMPAA